MAENTALLVAGLVIGTLSAALAVLPHLVGGGRLDSFTMPAVLVLAALATGTLAGLLALVPALRGSLIPALRND
jgi:hypothetical protein